MNKAKKFIRKFLLHLKAKKVAIVYNRKKSKKKLFIDGGSNLGQGYSFFSKYFSPDKYDYIFIEPNPSCMRVIKKKFNQIRSAKFLEKAIWIKEEKLSFFGLVEDHRGNTSQGGSVLNNHNSSMYASDENRAIYVDAFSFSDFLSEIGKDYNTIIVKMDIESAEYDVLRDLIDKKTISLIDHLFVEFHSQYFEAAEQPIYRQLEKGLIHKINSTGIGFTRWF